MAGVWSRGAVWNGGRVGRRSMQDGGLCGVEGYTSWKALWDERVYRQGGIRNKEIIG